MKHVICPVCFEEAKPAPHYPIKTGILRCQSHNSSHRFVFRDHDYWFLSLYDRPNLFTVEIGNENPRHGGANPEYFIYLENGYLDGKSYSIQKFELCEIVEVLNRILKMKLFL